MVLLQHLLGGKDWSQILDHTANVVWTYDVLQLMSRLVPAKTEVMFEVSSRVSLVLPESHFCPTALMVVFKKKKKVTFLPQSLNHL